MCVNVLKKGSVLNNLIKELAENAGLSEFTRKTGNCELGNELEKFADLIIKECIKVSEAHAESLNRQPSSGMDFEAYEEGIVNGIYEATAAIKEHFGIKLCD